MQHRSDWTCASTLLHHRAPTPSLCAQGARPQLPARRLPRRQPGGGHVSVPGAWPAGSDSGHGGAPVGGALCSREVFLWAVALHMSSRPLHRGGRAGAATAGASQPAGSRPAAPSQTPPSQPSPCSPPPPLHPWRVAGAQRRLAGVHRAAGPHAGLQEPRRQGGRHGWLSDGLTWHAWLREGWSAC